MFKTVFAATAALVITAIPAQAQTCTRDGLKAIVNGGLPDVHMFKIRNGKIEMIQAVFGGNAQGAIWPDETK